METDWFRGQLQSAAAEVKLFGITRGMPRRIEEQYIRHWAFVPSLWNLYFREQVNTGLSLSAQSQAHAAVPQEAVEQDAAVAAAQLYRLLTHGSH